MNGFKELVKIVVFDIVVGGKEDDCAPKMNWRDFEKRKANTWVRWVDEKWSAVDGKRNVTKFGKEKKPPSSVTRSVMRETS